MPAKTEYLILARLALAGIAREVPMDEAVLADLKLAVTEACGNAVRHAHAGDARGRSRALRDDGRDDRDRRRGRGPGIPAVVPAATPDVDDLSEGGMGLAIIRAVVDELEIDGRDGGPGTVVRMRKQLVSA